MSLTHFNESGRARMVEVTEKSETLRIASAVGQVKMKRETLELITGSKIKKGDVLSVAQVAGIMGAKKTSEVIPMCHPLMLTGVDMSFEVVEEGVIIHSEVRTVGKTGVEMEALMAVSVAALTIYDMCKAVDKEMIIGEIMLLEKQGGASGHYKRSEGL